MRLVAAYKHYPVTVARFFVAALRRQGHTVDTVGPYSGDDGMVPWPGFPHFPQHVDRPAFIFSEMTQAVPAPWLGQLVELGGYDAIISFDAGFRLTGAHPAVSALYGTDPHARKYEHWTEYDKFFSAQQFNLERGDQQGLWVPLGYDPTVHTCTTPLSRRPLDLCFVGVLEGPTYATRKEALELLAQRHTVMATTGLVYDDCTNLYNTAKIAFNFSASWDIPMRFFEAFGYGCCNVTNRVPHIAELGFVENQHYMAFESPEELLDKTDWLLRDDHWQKIARAGRERALKVDCTYDARAKQLVEAL